MSLRKLYIVLIILIVVIGISYAQNKDDNKYTTKNVMLKTIYTCKKGLIVEYFAGGKNRQIYLPNKFFDDGKAVRVIDDDGRATPQMNIIYKNLEPMKVKVYTPTLYTGITYQVIEFLSKEQEEAFETDELKFDFGKKDDSGK